MEEKSNEFIKSFIALCKRYNVTVEENPFGRGLYIEMDGYSGYLDDLYFTVMMADNKKDNKNAG